MQTDFGELALPSAADLSVMQHAKLVTCNGMGYTLYHDSEFQAQRIGEVFHQGNCLRHLISP
jgi:small ligand-binding sensory domain FIST